MERGIELIDVRHAYRGTLVARIDVRIAGFIIVRGIEVHRRSDGVVFLKLPQAVGWPTRKIASRFNVATLTLLGYAHPELMTNGKLAAPLLDPLNNEGGAMPNR